MIPKEVNGLPTHALAVHAAVMLVPLAALLAVLFVIPRTRHWAAIPLPLVTLGALVSLYVARASGFNLKAYFVNLQGASAFDKSVLGDKIKIHEARANTLFYLFIVFTIVVLAVGYLYFRERERFTGALQLVASALLVIGALVVVVQVVRVGDAGARTVWNPTGDQNYGVSSISSRVPLS